MILHSVFRPFHSADDAIDIEIADGKILDVGQPSLSKSEFIVDFESAVVMPGLFNAHDHLDFSLFPKLGHGPYKNYGEWGGDIHRSFKDEINRVLRISAEDRQATGILKNLLSGVTTVIDHSLPSVRSTEALDVVRGYQYIHAIGTDKNWKWKMLKLSGSPVMLHLGEGTDEMAAGELAAVLKRNWFDRDIVAIHLIEGDWDLVQKLKAMIWCPDSNFFLYAQTTPIEKVKGRIPIFLGTDSPLTGSSNFWDHVRLARSLNYFSDQELFDIITNKPTQFFNQNKPFLHKGDLANLVVFKVKPGNLFDADPDNILLSIKDGRIILYDDLIKLQLGDLVKHDAFDAVRVKDRIKHIRGRWKGTIERILASGITLPLNLVPA